MTTREAPAETKPVRDTGASAARRDRRLVVATRTALIMLLIAGVALVAIGVGVLLLIDPPDASDWLRSIFGGVFGHIAVGIGLAIGIPALLGVWAMAGATAEGATPALSPTVRRMSIGIAVATLALAALVVLVAGPGLRLLDIALIGIVALPTLGLAGAVRSSPHRNRAIGTVLALVVLAAGVGWLLLQTWRLVRP